MKRRSNIHTHSLYSDGRNSLEELALAAIDKGFVSLGFSEHAYAPYDSDVCMPKADLARYLAEAGALREKYRGRLELYIGLELDSYYDTQREGLDFTLAAAHYLRDPLTGEHYTIDHKPELFERALTRAAGGDIRRMLALYFDELLGFVQRCRPDVIAHLDLITKLNAGGRYWDEGSGWYRDLLEKTADGAAAAGCIVEVNTGGIARGYRKEPYPSRALLELLHDRGVPVLLSSDAHSAEHLDFWFDEAEALLREIGYRALKQLRGGRFVDVEL